MDLKNIDELGITLKELRTDKGLNQEDLANMLNVKRQTYSAWERGISSPDIETLSFLADFYSVSTDYLLGRTDTRNTSDEISNAVEDDPELLDFWNELKEREDLQLLFKQTKSLSPKDIKQIIRIIKAIEDEEDKIY